MQKLSSSKIGHEGKIQMKKAEKQKKPFNKAQQEAQKAVHEALGKGYDKWAMEYEVIKAKYDQLGSLCRIHRPSISPLELDFGSDFDRWAHQLSGKDKAISIKHKLDECERAMHQFRQEHRLHDV